MCLSELLILLLINDEIVVRAGHVAYALVLVVIAEASSSNIRAYTLHLFLLHSVLPHVLIYNKLFNVRCMELMPFVLGCDQKACRGEVN